LAYILEVIQLAWLPLVALGFFPFLAAQLHFTIHAGIMAWIGEKALPTVGTICRPKKGGVGRRKNPCKVRVKTAFVQKKQICKSEFC
jgi:hypothetical protein